MRSPPPTISHVSPWLINLVYPLCRHLILPVYFGKIEIHGRENFPLENPVILAPTHRSRWDALILGYALGRDIFGRDLRFMVSANEMKGLQGWLIRHVGGFPIDPQHPSISSLRLGIKLLKASEVLVIFPEGNIFRTEEIQPLQPGLTRLALHTQCKYPSLDVKIVPIKIRYNPPIPGWGCHVQVHIGSCLQVANYCENLSSPNTEKLKNHLKSALENLCTSRQHYQQSA